jgi:ectoine hydroxylase-related dioxygenase (phytanoyl-CoA dioxygenase family)
MKTHLTQFARHGYCVAKGLLSKDAVERVKKSIYQSYQDQVTHILGPQTKPACREDMKTLFDHDLARYRKTSSALWRKLDVYNLLHSEAVSGFLHTEFGWSDLIVAGGQVVHIMADDLRVPEGYFGLGAHQDFPSVQGSLDAVIVWIPLTNVTENSYPVEIIVGSHLRGELPTVGVGHTPWELRPDSIANDVFTPVCANVGDVVFLSVFTVHRSSTVGSKDAHRIAISTRFDNANEPTFVERVYPCAYERSVHRAPYFPGFPTPEQVRAVFGAKAHLD